MIRFVLALDGGNTKSIAVVATTEGLIVGRASGGCGDIYGRPGESEEESLQTLAQAITDALGEAGIPASRLEAVVASLAGADWPEDYELYRRELRDRTGFAGTLEVVNDGLGPLPLGDPGGIGLAVAVGTGVAIGARGPTQRIWHASFWLPYVASAAATLGRRGLDSVYRHDLGLGPPTSVTAQLLERYAVADVESLLHSFTRRGSGSPALRQASLAVLDEDGAGDPVAHGIVDAYAAELAPYAHVAAKKVGLQGAFPLVLTGGLLRHRTSSLAGCIAQRIAEHDPGARAVFPSAMPVAGSLLRALAISGDGTVSEHVRELILKSPELQYPSSPTGLS